VPGTAKFWDPGKLERWACAHGSLQEEEKKKAGLTGSKQTGKIMKSCAVF
jgi:hypothetical protein